GAAGAAVRVAQANANALRGTLFPRISASCDASRQLTPTQTLTSNVPSGADTYSLHTPQVSVAFVPDVFGGTRRAIESAQAQAEAQAFQREAVYLTLSSNIALEAIQEASLRGQIAATRRLIDIQTQLLAPGTLFWTIAGNATQTVFDAGSRYFKQQAAEETTTQAAAQYRQTVLVAFQNVADVLRALQADAKAVAAAAAAEEAASRSIDLVRRQVEQGQVSSPVLLNAQQAYLQTSLARVQAQAA